MFAIFVYIYAYMVISSRSRHVPDVEAIRKKNTYIRIYIYIYTNGHNTLPIIK